MHDLNQVATFVEVVRSGSFAAAARSVALPRSTVSARIAKLEAQLGFRLFKRSTRAMMLTQEGLAYYNEVAAATDTLLTAHGAIPTGDGGFMGSVSIAAPSEYPFVVLSTALQNVRRKHLRLSVHVALQNDVSDFIEHRIDIAIRGNLAGSPGLVARRLPNVPFGLFAAPSYLESVGTPTAPENLSNHSILGLRTRTVPRAGPFPDISASSVGLTSDSMALLMQLAADGMGIASLPRHLCRHEVAAGRLVPICPEWDGGGAAATYLVFQSRRDATPRVRAVADEIYSAAAAFAASPF